MSHYSEMDNDQMIGGLRSKYSTLPKISDVSSTDLIPYKSQNSHSSGDVVDRVNDLETRLHITEKSNRALLEEVVRLHGEFRTTTKYYEDAFKEERKIRSFIENQWKSGQDHIRELEQRLRNAEEVLSQEKYKIRGLMDQSKNVEEQVYANKNDHKALNERQYSKVAQLEREVENLYDERQKLEKISFHLVEEMKTIKSKLESQGYDFSAITSELRNKSKRLEDEYNNKIESVKKHLRENSPVEQGYRGTVEAKITEMKHQFNQIRQWHEEEIGERRNLEKSMMSKISELTTSMSDMIRNREEAIRQLQYEIKEKEHKAETEKLSMQNKLAEIAENINSKVLEKDLRLREEQLKRQAELEKLLRSEQETRISYEREIRQENERRMDAIRQLQSEELNNIKDSLKNDKTKYVESVKRLDEAVSLTERQIEETKNELNKIITAEIRARTQKEKVVKDKVFELEEKIVAATSALQTALSGIAEKSIPNSEKLRKLINDIIDEYKGGINRQIADLDTRLLTMQSLGTKNIGNVDEKIDEAVSRASNSLKDKIQSISLWQGSVNTSLSEIRIQDQKLKQEIYEMNETLTLTKSDFKARFDVETETRIEAIENLRQEVDRLKDSLPKDVVTKAELDKIKTTSRKLAESMQTIKTVLGMKIQSEQKLDLQAYFKLERIEEIKSLQEDLAHLRAVIEPFVHSKMLPRIFIKNDDDADQSRDEREINAQPINQWSIYNAYKWLNWKSRVMYLKWLNSNRNKPDDSKPEPKDPEDTPPKDSTHPWDEEKENSPPPPDAPPPEQANP